MSNSTITAGRILLEQDQDGAITIVYRGATGHLRVPMDAKKLEAMCLRKLREDAFAMPCEPAPIKAELA